MTDPPAFSLKGGQAQSRTPEQEAELQRLIEEQRAEMQQGAYQDPEYPDGRSVPVLPYDALEHPDYMLASSENDPAEALGADLSAVEDERGSLVESLVSEVLEGFPASWQETYWLVYGERKSIRASARRQNLDESTLRYRLERMRKAVKHRIAQEAGWI